MAAYGDYEELCPEQTFTEEAKLRNFPDSTRAPWTVVSTFGPTASGCEGFTAIIPYVIFLLDPPLVDLTFSAVK